jgi:ribosomal protein S18 acetylase RimI-like enzyme
MGEPVARHGEITIRPMTEDDIEAVLAIDRQIAGPDRATTYDTLPSSYVGGELDLSVVAEAKGKVVGFLLGRVQHSPYEEATAFLLELIGVDPTYRRHGIGRRMVEAFEAQCRHKGGGCAIRAVVSWHDWWMLSFLRSQGFVRGDMAEFVKRIEE